MRFVRCCLILSLGFFVNCEVQAQSVDGSQTRRSITANEYIESTSPLQNGGSVTSRVQPGRNVQTVTTIANLPVLGSGGAAAGVAQGAATGQSNGSQTRNTAASYPYPAANRPAATVAQFPTQRPQLPAQNLPTSTRQTAFQVPTLGLTPVARTAQNCNCAPAPPRFFQPQQQGFAPAAAQAPSLGGVPNINIQVPGQTGGFAQPGFAQQGFQASPFQSGNQVYTPNYGLQSGIGTPQFGNTGFGGGSNWLTTFLTGRGQYPNLLSFRNLPPGTQLGQGIIGQPTAYVDGQPARNLFRWLLPF